MVGGGGSTREVYLFPRLWKWPHHAGCRVAHLAVLWWVERAPVEVAALRSGA